MFPKICMWMQADDEGLSREWERDRQATQVCLSACQYLFIANKHALWNCAATSANMCLSMHLNKPTAKPIKSPPLYMQSSSFSAFSSRFPQYHFCVLPEIWATLHICKFSDRCYFIKQEAYKGMNLMQTVRLNSCTTTRNMCARMAKTMTAWI